MCGIGGIIGSSPISQREIDGTEAMLEHLETRGPDGNGIFAENKVCLVHTRLSIQDVSDRASQPMVSKCGRYAIVFNGEIYNFQSLKDEYLGDDISWNTTSDTEVLLQLLIDYEPDKVIDRIEGMYSFCFVDLIGHVAVLGRDYFGQKPLYYWRADDRLLFCSSFNGIKHATSEISKQEISKHSVEMFLGTGFIHQPSTICDDIYQLERGATLTVEFGRGISARLSHGLKKAHSMHLPDTLQGAISDSVEKCLVSDVPVGCFLSGGIDSSIITAIASRFGPVNSYCVGFKNKSFDESIHAEKIAQKLRSNHETYYLTDDEIVDIASKIPEIFGEPFADPSAIPLVALARFAKKDIKVALTGDGGDELFYGYNRHVLMRRVSFIRKSKALSSLIKKVNGHRHPIELMGRFLKINAFPEKLEKLSSFIDKDSNHSYWDYFSTGFYSFQDTNQIPERNLNADVLRELDIDCYQWSNTLVKSDRSSMYSGVELRAPLLEKVVGEYVKDNISSHTEIYGFKGKKSLRELAYSLVGKDLLDRQKAGFTPPLVEWLEGPLSSWASQGLHSFYQSEFGRNLERLDSSSGNTYLYTLQRWRYAIMGHWLKFHGYI